MKTIVYTAALVALESGAAAALPSGDVFDDARAISVCVTGAIIGAFLTVAVLPNSGSDSGLARKLALKFGASAAGGLAFTPAWMQWVGMPRTMDYLMGCSAFTACCVVSILSAVVPLVESMAVKVVANRLRKAAKRA